MNLFYDDDPMNIMEMSKLPKTKSIHIINKPVNLNYKERHNYYKNFENNSYYNYFKPQGTPSCGFSMSHAEDLINCINKSVVLPVVLFDWDRTITCFDGFAIENYPFTYSSVGIRVQDVMEYICGGYTRLNLLSYLFQRIRKKGEIFILTNNPISVNNRPEFIKMIRAIDPHFKEKCLIYGNGNKRLALLQCNYFIDITNKLK